VTKEKNESTMTELNNGNINAFKNDINVLSNDQQRYIFSLLQKFSIPINKIDTSNELIDWNSIKESYSFFFDYVGCEEEISSMLFSSQLSEEKSLIIEMGYDDPIIEVKTETFIKNWYNFFAASGFMGISVYGTSEKNFMEFTDRNFLLYSNFIINKGG
jgi:hypothetical protein